MLCTRSVNTKRASALAEPLLAEGGTDRLAPLRAHIQLSTGNLRQGDGDLEGAASKCSCAPPRCSAAEGKDAVNEAVAWMRLLYLVGRAATKRFDEAALIRSFGQLAVHDQDDPREAAWLEIEGLVLTREGAAQNREDKLREAKALIERSVAMSEKVGPDNVDLGSAYNNLGTVLTFLDDNAGARAAYERGLGHRGAGGWGLVTSRSPRFYNNLGSLPLRDGRTTCRPSPTTSVRSPSTRRPGILPRRSPSTTSAWSPTRWAISRAPDQSFERSVCRLREGAGPRPPGTSRSRSSASPARWCASASSTRPSP